MSADFDPMDPRVALKPFVGKRITIEGHIRRFDRFVDGRTHRNIPTVLLADVEIISEDANGNESREYATDHVTVVSALSVVESGAQPGDVVRLEVLVHKYHQRDRDDPNVSVTRYGLRDPLAVEIVREAERRPPAPIYKTMNMPTPPTVFPEETPADPSPPPMSDKELLVTLIDLAEVVSLDRLEKMVAVVKMMKS